MPAPFRRAIATLVANVGAFVFSAAGLLLGHWIASRSPTVEARGEPAPAEGVVSAREIELVDAQGRRLVLMATSAEGRPGMWFYDRNGKARLSLGLYGDDNASLVLNDDHEQAVQIFRTLGPRSDPFLVMKAQGRDRIILGLGGPDANPFLVYYDADGTKRTAFGNY
jgi:hypothetical protein